MAQNIQYLYEYEKGKRVRNLGFMRVDRQMDKCTIQIYAKNMDEVKGILFQAQDERKYLGGWEPELHEIEDAPSEEPTIEEERVYFEEGRMEAEEYIPPHNISFEKIQRQELSRLPRKDWRLANNSFLLHGFYNYHHLLYIEDDGEVWIGVPGIYHEKERMAAGAFGFTHFRRVADVPIELDENEKNTYEDFGYWCRQITIPKV